MKKTYIQPTSDILRVHVRSLLLSTSVLGVGDDMNSGSGDSREVDFELDGEY